MSTLPVLGATLGITLWVGAAATGCSRNTRAPGADSGAQSGDAVPDISGCSKIKERCRTVEDCCPYDGKRGDLVCDPSGHCGILHL
jgi:hypothetical protein